MANNKVNKNRHEIEIKVDKERWQKELDNAFNIVSKNAKIDGFRKGKVPREVFDKKIGKQEYIMEAANKIVSEEFTKVLKENNYKLVAEPQIKLTTMDDDTLEFTMVLIEEPEVNVKKYKGLGIKKDKIEVTDHEIEHEIHHLLERYSEVVVKESDVVENGDIAVIDFEGFKDGVAFDGGKGENYPLEIGSNSFIPGFEEQIIGMKREEEKDINVTFPEEYHSEELKGQPVVFKVKVNEIKVKEQRQLDKDLFDDLGMEGVDSEDTLKEEIKKSIEASKEMEAENKYVKDLLDAINKNTEVDIPEEMVFDTVEMMFNQLRQNLGYQGIDLNTYMTYTGQTEEVIRAQMEKEAFERVLSRLALEKIKELENITITDEEVDSKIKEYTDKFNIKEEDVLKEFDSKEMLKYDLEMNKVLDFLKDANK